MKIDWQERGSARLRRAAWGALALGAIVASAASLAQVRAAPAIQPETIKVDCGRMPEVCELSRKAIAAQVELQYAYLKSVGACARVAACSKGIKPNESPSLAGHQRTIAATFQICYALCAAKSTSDEEINACIKQECGVP